MAKRRKSTREQAVQIAKYIGCRGAHEGAGGNWLPCADEETLMRISNEAEKRYVEKRINKRRRRSMRDGYEPLGYRGVGGIDTIPGVGLVSGKNIIIGRAKPRRGDPDVYDDPNAARLRSRALGCIGIARRETPDGEIVWTPCTNVSDFRRRTGQSVLGRRDETRRFARMLREVGGPTVQRRRMRRFEKSEDGLLVEKRLRTIGGGYGNQAQYDQTARDADGDGVVQEGTDFARSASQSNQTRQKKNPPKPIEAGNIDLSKRKPVKLADGSFATVRSMSVNINGVEVLLPTIGPKGENWDPDTDAGFEAAIAHYERTGQHLGKFRNSAEATAYGDWLHNQEAQRIAKPRGGAGAVQRKTAKQAGRRRAPRGRLASTPAPPKDQIVGSRRNPRGTASSASRGADISIDASTQQTLVDKVRAHNEKMRKANKPEWSMATLNKLKVVYRRGAGAFSVSHRPGMTRGQWALGRVNAFLKMLESGKPSNPRYVTDNDLLSQDHPWKKGKLSK